MHCRAAPALIKGSLAPIDTPVLRETKWSAFFCLGKLRDNAGGNPDSKLFEGVIGGLMQLPLRGSKVFACQVARTVSAMISKQDSKTPF